jgi:hypothetical protein
VDKTRDKLKAFVFDNFEKILISAQEEFLAPRMNFWIEKGVGGWARINCFLYF